MSALYLDGEETVNALVSPWQRLRTGEYILPNGIAQPSADMPTMVYTANRISAWPLVLPRPMTLDRIAIHVTGTGAPGTTARLGIYGLGTNLYPGALLVDAGTVVVDATGVKPVTISLSVAAGIIFMVMITDGAPTIHAFRPSIAPLGIVTTSFAYVTGSWYKDAQGAELTALSDPFVASAALNGGNAPLVVPRLLTLD